MEHLKGTATGPEIKTSGTAPAHRAPVEISRQSLAHYLEGVLEPGRFKDYCPNGLQVEGTPVIRRLATAVTASLAAVRQAAQMGADALLVHHGYFWRGEDPRLVGPRRERVATLLGAGINLFAYHLPLDLHPSLGNNAQLGERLGWTVAGQCGEGGLVCLADLAGSLDAGSVAALLAARLDHQPTVVGRLDRPIRRIAWCTGAAQDMLEAAVEGGADAFVSGEISERTTHLARELGVVYFAAGHHATERFGVQALGANVSAHFGVEHRYIDDPNPV